jgi:hypothetical protein
MSGTTAKAPTKATKEPKAIKEPTVPKHSNGTTSVPKKRGRKSKQELMDIINGITEPAVAEPAVKPSVIEPKAVDDVKRARRGRKPNSAKIMDNVHAINMDTLQHLDNNHLPTTILHLKCRLADTLEMNNYTFCDLSHASHLNANAFDLNMDQSSSESKNAESLNTSLNYSQILDQANCTQYETLPVSITDNNNGSKPQNQNQLITTTTSLTQPKHKLKELNKKIKHLDFILSSNIEIKKSACFWCTEKFDGPAMYIPKACVNNVFQVYGNFCSLECGAAHLMKMPVHQSTIMEQYALMHSLYLDRQPNFMDCIKPAPEPRYMLDKFLGNLSITEYRELNRNGRFFILLDKPVVKITPEYHEEYSNFKIQETNIPTASS